jgi:hypothetical protein
MGDIHVHALCERMAGKKAKHYELETEGAFHA